MIKQIIFRILKKLGIFFLKLTYNFIDTDNDGQLSKKEIKEFTKLVSKMLKGRK